MTDEEIKCIIRKQKRENRKKDAIAVFVVKVILYTLLVATVIENLCLIYG